MSRVFFIVWIRKLFNFFFPHKDNTIIIYVDEDQIRNQYDIPTDKDEHDKNTLI